MRLKLIIILLMAAVIGGAGIYYWKHYNPPIPPFPPEADPPLEEEKGGDERRVLYRCPMHPSYTSDKPGQCPICGMNLVPVEKQSTDDRVQRTDKTAGQHDGTIAQPHDRTHITIPLERQQLIGVKTATIQKQRAIKKIRTAATAAFNPELAIAQREYLEAKKIGEASLVEAARDRLILLGMNEDEIGRLKNVQKGLYLPQGDSWIYPVVYEYELPYVKIGQEVKITLSDTREVEGVIRSIDSVIDPMTRTARLHVELKEKVRPSTFGIASIEIDLGEKLLLPKSAVINTGARSIAFVVHDGTHFMPAEVKLGAELEDFYVLEDGLNEGDAVVASATFLIDSESRLKAAIGGAAEGGGHKH